jgi:two-component system, sensor histidine kinase and response regulator
VGCSIVEIYPNHPQIVELIKRALGGEMLHLVGNEPSDLTLETWLQPLIGEHGKPDGVLGVAIDVTERVRADTALQQQSELLQRIIDNIPVMINVFDAQGKLSLINREHERILGYPFEQVSVREQMSRYYPDPDVLKSVMEFIATPDSGWRDFPTLTKNGQMIHTSWANVRLSDGAVLGIGQDISERVRIARELQSAKEAAESANRAKSMFLANMSHELRTPLNVILGFAQLLEREPTIKPDQQNHLRVIARSGEHLLSLINDVLEMSKIEIGNVPLQEIDFDLHRMLEGIQEMLRVRAENKQISLQLLRAPEVPQYIHADERKLRQVIINLLTNAIKFTDEGGVTMRIQYHRGFGGTARLIFEVEDTGRGIKPERLAALFEPFARLEDSTSKEGTGLGLALSRQFARMMGGEVVLRSEVGRGTLAHFEILIADGANIKPPQDPVVRRVIGLEAGQHALRVLIAEDNMDSRLLLSQAMRSVGFEVRVVENGVHCVQVAAQWHPHLIWMDMRMPEMDGYEATRQIKKGKSAPVIVAITASAFDHERANVLAAGCDDFIAKPFQIDWLFECMRKHLHVRFRYADTTPVKTGQLRARLDTGLLSTIPPDLLRALKVAAVELDSSRMYELITRVRNYDENVANALYNNAKSFRFDRILEELERVEGQKQS